MSVQISSTSIQLEEVREARVNQAVALRGQFIVTVFNNSPSVVDIQLDGQLDGGAGFTKSDSALKTVGPNQITTIYMPLWLKAYYPQSGQARLTGNLQIYDRNNWQTIGYDSKSIEFQILPE